MFDSDNRVLSFDDCLQFRKLAKENGARVVLTNGCFDILHRGHVEYLRRSAELGDRLVIAVNSDVSVQILKGPGRPVNREEDRAATLASLRCVDAVTIFPGPRLENEILGLTPDVYTKAGDYTLETLDPSERTALEAVGAEIHFIPFVKGYSTTSTLEKAANISSHGEIFRSTAGELIEVLKRSNSLENEVRLAGEIIRSSLLAGNKIFTCGNGGSAADALHLAEELVGKYRAIRRPLPGICLNADVTSLTCIANDFGYESVFSRSVEALGNTGDVLIGFSTSGNSANVIAAIRRAKQIGLRTILLSGHRGGMAKSECDVAIIVPSDNTARIQEVHTVILHHWLETIDEAFASSPN